jgi:uncharacterized protein YajQ (UPF0234 family)
MPSFDIVSEVNAQEVRNAVDQASRELINRYDFKGTDTSVESTEDTITVESDSEGRLGAANDVLKSKLIRREISLKALGGGEPQPIGGSRFKSVWTLANGIPQDAAKELSKEIRDAGLRAKAQIQGDQLRVQGKKRDELQAVIAMLRALDYRLPLQFTNFRD